MNKLILIAIVVIAGLAVAAAVGVRLLMSPDRVRSAVEIQASAALGMPVKVGSASIQLWPRAGLTMSDVRVGEPAQVTLAQARLSTGLWPLLSRRVEDAEIVVENSRLDLLQLLGALGGLAQSTSTPAKSTKPAETPALTIVSIRSIGLNNVELVAGQRQAIVSLDSSLIGDRLELHHLTAKTAETNLEATGAVVSILRRIVHLKISGDPLDLDGLMQFAGVFSQAAAASAAAPAASGSTAPPAPLDLQADVRAPRGRVAGMTFTDLQTSIAVTPNGVTLRPLMFNALDGRFEGLVTVTLSRPAPVLGIDGAVSGVNLQQLAQFASGEPSSITGTLEARMKLSGRGLDADSAIKTASGTADVALVKGRIPGLQLVRPAVLAFGRPQGAPPEGNGEAFERITSTITVDHGQLRTSNLVFDSRDVDVKGAGTLTVNGAALDVRGNLMLSEELSAQAGRDLVRYAHEGNRVVLPAVVSGTVSSPFVTIDAGQALKRAVTNELQQRTNDAFKRLLPGRSKKPPQH